MIEICAVSGYEEVGGNLTAVRVDDDVILLDMGINVEHFIEASEQNARSADELMHLKAIPNITLIKDWAKDVKAIIPSHAHLDHIGAIPHLEKRFDAPIMGTPFTIAVLEQIAKNEKIVLKNPCKKLRYNKKYQITKKVSVELIEITHSAPHAALIVLRTPYGNIVYGNDFKMDHSPTLGLPPDIERMKKLGEEGVKVFLIDSTRIVEEGRTESEAHAAKKVREAMLKNAEGGLIVSTFSSHIARIRTICETAQEMGREVLFMGRSLSKYLLAAKDVGLFDYEPYGELVPYKSMIRKKLKSIAKNLDKYVLLVTGHQGEPQAVLSSMIRNQLPCVIKEGDCVIFSCTVIPTEANIAQREKLDQLIMEKNISIEKDVHASGHPRQEDVAEILSYLKPELVIPSHCTPEFREEMAKFVESLGYNVKVMRDGERIVLQ
jgi:ribonuclease J